MSDRDTKFAGFARLLNKEINDFAFSFGSVLPETDTLQRGIEQLIARRAYDLVESACADISMEQSDGRLSVSGMLACITDDLSAFPKEGI